MERAEGDLTLFRLREGSVLKREAIAAVITLAAMAVGVDPEKMGSHSLRIGGATAMYHATQDLKLVQRYGRWASDAFMGYLWEAHEGQKGLAARMGRDDWQLTKAKEA